MAIADLTAAQKDELVTSLAVLAIYDCDAEITSDNISSVVKASGNSVASHYPGLFADLIGRGIKIDKCLAGPSAGGAPAVGGATTTAAAVVEEEVVEEEEEDIGGADNMFKVGGEDY